MKKLSIDKEIEVAQREYLKLRDKLRKLEDRLKFLFQKRYGK